MTFRRLTSWLLDILCSETCRPDVYSPIHTPFNTFHGKFENIVKIILARNGEKNMRKCVKFCNLFWNDNKI